VAALARRLGVPFRSGGSLCASKLPDAQAAYESAATLIPTIMGGVNFVLHAAGWLEGGLAIGYEKFVLDCDQLGMMATFVKGLDLSDNGQALDAIRENPPGNHFLGTAHTLANFETAFYRSSTADNSSFEQWTGTVRSTPRSVPTGSGRSSWRRTSRRRSTKPPTRSCATSSNAGRPSSPTSSPDGGRRRSCHGNTILTLRQRSVRHLSR
jgi:trimethylamine:corrinoid methyltransferase-like protein